jgi:hypothetical protein
MTVIRLGKAVEEAPINTKSYIRQNGQWVEIGGETDTAHNDLTSIQGGNTTQRYHLTATQHTQAIREANATQNGLMSSTYANQLDNSYTAVEVDQLIKNGFERIDITSAGTYSLTEIGNVVYAVSLVDGDVVINLPTPTESTEGQRCIIYVEVNSVGNTLTINGVIRGATSQVLEKRYDAIELVAHMLSTPHYDVVSWNRTDNIIYRSGNLGTTSINTLQQILGYELSPSVITGCEVTASGGLVTVQAGEVLLYNTASDKDVRLFKFNGGTYNQPDNTLKYLALFNNTGVVELRTYDSLFAITDRRNTLIATCHRRGVHTDILETLDYSTNLGVRLFQAEAVKNWLERVIGLILTGDGLDSLVVSPGLVYKSVIAYTIPQLVMNIDNPVEWWYNTDEGWQVENRTTINNQNYNIFGTSLPALANINRFASHWVYVCVNNPSRLIVVYSQAQYSSVGNARVAQPPIDAQLPKHLANYGLGVLVGKIVVGLDSVTPEFLSPFALTFSFTNNPV